MGVGVKVRQYGQHDSRGAPVSDHVQDSTELAGLVEPPRSHSVKQVERERQDIARQREMPLCGVSREAEEDDRACDARVPDEVGDEEENICGRRHRDTINEKGEAKVGTSDFPYL